MVKRKRSVKKKPTTTELAPGLDVEFLDEVPNFSELLASWTSEAGKSIPKMPQTILEFVKNMGVKSRKNSKGETQDVKAPAQEYINRAASAGAEESYTPEQIAAVKSLRDYLKENNTDSSKINPQNIKYNSIAGYDRAGKVLAPVDVYGDYRTRKFVNYQKRFKARS